MSGNAHHPVDAQPQKPTMNAQLIKPREYVVQEVGCTRYRKSIGIRYYLNVVTASVSCSSDVQADASPNILLLVHEFIAYISSRRHNPNVEGVV